MPPRCILLPSARRTLPAATRALGFACGRRLGDEPDHRLGARRADVQPAIGPAPAAAHPAVRAPRPGRAPAASGSSGARSPPRGRLGLNNSIAVRERTSADRPCPAVARYCKMRAAPSGASRPTCSAGQDHAPVPLPADQGPLLGDGPGHVGLADRGPDEPRAAVPRGVLHHQAGREVRDHHRPVADFGARASTARTANARV